MNTKTINKIFAPQTQNELFELMSIANESKFIDIKPYSHNIVGLVLRILSETYKYDDNKIKLVVRVFGLHKKGWGYLLEDNQDSKDYY